MYSSLKLPWSTSPSTAEIAYQSAGLVKTKGTIFLLPPAQTILKETFISPARPRSRMSSGAVALCKHFERGGASSEHGRAHPFWTLPIGSNENKDRIALQVLDKMLEDAQWKNIMLLHKGVAVYEIRNGLGFGMRWTLELEDGGPSKADGIEDGQTTDQSKDNDIASNNWMIQKTIFRGFLEPIEGLDQELP